MPSSHVKQLKGNPTTSSSSEQSTSCLLCLHLLLLKEDLYHQMGANGCIIQRLTSSFDIRRHCKTCSSTVGNSLFGWALSEPLSRFQGVYKYRVGGLKERRNAIFFLCSSSVWCITGTVWYPAAPIHLKRKQHHYKSSRSGFVTTLTYYKSWSAEAGAADTVAVGSVATGAGLAAALAVVSRRTRLVAV